MKVCNKYGCCSTHKARGLCHRHYQQYLAAGGEKKPAVKGTPLERFHQLYDIRANSNCWVWKGFISDRGNPTFGVGQKQGSAKRFLFEHLNGELPIGKLLWSQCGNSLCVNPEHSSIVKKPSQATIEENRARDERRALRQKLRAEKELILSAKAQARKDRRARAKVREEELAAKRSALKTASAKMRKKISKKIEPVPFRASSSTLAAAPASLSENWDYSFCVFLPKGEHAIIDVASLDLFDKYRWNTFRRPNRNTEPYVVSSCKPRSLRLHRLLMNCPDGLVVDHINHNPRDNRLCNLRIATHAENCHNIRKLRPASSAFKGVTLCRQSQKWKAYIRPLNGPRHGKHVLGYFDSEVDAALAFNEAAMVLHGEFACLNQVKSSTAP